jgi:hypothetical protein
LSYAFRGFKEFTYDFTPVPDEFFDRFLPDLSVSEFKVFLYIMRRTAGFKKRVDAISLGQICDGYDQSIPDESERRERGTGLTRQGAKKAIASLLSKGLIEKAPQRDSRGGSLPNLYAIRRLPKLDSTDIEGGQQALPPPAIGVAPGGARVLPHKKQKLQETESSSSTPPPDRKPPQREEEDLKPVTAAIETYAPADPAIVSKIVRLVQAAAPEIGPPGLVILIHSAVPKDFPVKSAGYWLTALPKLFSSSHWKTLRPLLDPSIALADKSVWVTKCLHLAEKTDPDRRYAELWRQHWDHAGDPTRPRAQDAG